MSWRNRGEISLIILSALLFGASVLGIGAGTAVKNNTQTTNSQAVSTDGRCNLSIKNGCYEGGCKDWEWCNPANSMCEWKPENIKGPTCKEQGSAPSLPTPTPNPVKPQTQQQTQPQQQATGGTSVTTSSGRCSYNGKSYPQGYCSPTSSNVYLFCHEGTWKKDTRFIGSTTGYVCGNIGTKVCIGDGFPKVNEYSCCSGAPKGSVCGDITFGKPAISTPTPTRTLPTATRTPIALPTPTPTDTKQPPIIFNGKIYNSNGSSAGTYSGLIKLIAKDVTGNYLKVQRQGTGAPQQFWIEKPTYIAAAQIPSQVLTYPSTSTSRIEITPSVFAIKSPLSNQKIVCKPNKSILVTWSEFGNGAELYDVVSYGEGAAAAKKFSKRTFTPYVNIPCNELHQNKITTTDTLGWTIELETSTKSNKATRGFILTFEDFGIPTPTTASTPISSAKTLVVSATTYDDRGNSSEDKITQVVTLLNKNSDGAYLYVKLLNGSNRWILAKNAPRIDAKILSTLAVKTFTPPTTRVAAATPAPTLTDYKVTLTYNRVYFADGKISTLPGLHSVIGRDSTSQYLFLKNGTSKIVVKRADFKEIDNSVIEKFPVYSLSGYSVPSLVSVTKTPTITPSPVVK